MNDLCFLPLIFVNPWSSSLLPKKLSLLWIMNQSFNLTFNCHLHMSGLFYTFMAEHVENILCFYVTTFVVLLPPLPAKTLNFSGRWVFFEKLKTSPCYVPLQLHILTLPLFIIIRIWFCVFISCCFLISFHLRVLLSGPDIFLKQIFKLFVSNAGCSVDFDLGFQIVFEIDSSFVSSWSFNEIRRLSV